MKKCISATMLSSYLYCKRKLFLERVLGLFEPDKQALVKGTIRHATYEKINKEEENTVKSIKQGTKFKELKDIYIHKFAALLRDSIKTNKKRLQNVRLTELEAFKKIFPRFVKESESRALNLYDFIQKYKVYGAELWEKLTPKIISEFKVKSENLLLTGIIDQIEEYKEGLVPVELKTGKMPKEGVWPGHKIQIGVYAMLLEELYNKEIKEGFVHYLDADERRQIPINPFLKEEIIDLRDKVTALLIGKELPDPEDNENKCKVCGLREKCSNNTFLNKKLSEKQEKEKL